MELSEPIVRVLDTTAQVATMLYGLFATVTDFKEKKGHRQVLSRAGHWGLLFLAITSISTISLSRVKQHNEDVKKDVATAAEAQRNKDVAEKLVKAIKLTQSISGTLDGSLNELRKQTGAMGELLGGERETLHATARILSPIDQILSLTVTETLDKDELTVAAYLKTHPFKIFRHRESNDVAYPDKTIASERPLYVLTSEQDVRVSFHSFSARTDYTSCMGDDECDPTVFKRNSMLAYTAASPSLLVVHGGCAAIRNDAGQSSLHLAVESLEYACEDSASTATTPATVSSYEDIHNSFVFIELNFFSKPIMLAKLHLQSVVLKGLHKKLYFKKFAEVPCRGQSTGKCYIARYL